MSLNYKYLSGYIKEIMNKDHSDKTRQKIIAKHSFKKI